MKAKLHLMIVGIILAVAAALSGCSYINQKVDKNPPSQRQQQCAYLQNELVLYQSTNPGMTESSTINTAQQAETMRLHDKYGCSKFEKS